MKDIWEGIDPKYRWTALDANRRRYYYVSRPAPDEGCCQWDSGGGEWKVGALATRGGRHWKDTLEERPVEVDVWEGVDPEYVFMATDLNGAQHVFTTEPKLGVRKWGIHTGRLASQDVCPDWMDTLVKRPEPTLVERLNDYPRMTPDELDQSVAELKIRNRCLESRVAELETQRETDYRDRLDRMVAAMWAGNVAAPVDQRMTYAFILHQAVDLLTDVDRLVKEKEEEMELT